MDLVEYIISLPPLKACNLYENEFVSLAVFRSLEPLPKQYVARLIFIDTPVPACELFSISVMGIFHCSCVREKLTPIFIRSDSALVTSWAKNSASTKHLAAIEILSRLQLMTSISKADDIFYSLNKDFRQNIQCSLSRGIFSEDLIPAPSEELHDLKELADSHASRQWEVRFSFLCDKKRTELQLF